MAAWMSHRSASSGCAQIDAGDLGDERVPDRDDRMGSSLARL